MAILADQIIGRKTAGYMSLTSMTAAIAGSLTILQL
jgi:hypothetical protein